MKAKTPKWMWLLESLLWWVPENLHEKPIPQIWYWTQVLITEGFYAWAMGEILGFKIYWNSNDGYTLFYDIVTTDILPISVEEEYVKKI